MAISIDANHNPPIPVRAKKSLAIDTSQAQKVDPILTLFVQTVTPSNLSSPSTQKDTFFVQRLIEEAESDESDAELDDLFFTDNVNEQEDSIPAQTEEDELSTAVTPKLGKEYASDFVEPIVVVNDHGRIRHGKIVFTTNQILIKQDKINFAQQ
jgi:hypothetical protein